MADDKVLKVRGDNKDLDRSFQQSTKLIQGFRQEVEKLNQALSQMGRAVLGQAAGGGGHSQRIPAQQGPGGTPTVSITSKLLESRQFFQTIATSSKSALTTMTAALKTESTAQEQHIRRLRKEVNELTSSYAHLDALRNRGIQLANPNAPMEVRQQMWDKMGQLGEAQQLQDSMRRGQLQMVSMQGGPGKWGARAEMLKQDVSGIGERAAGMMGVSPGIMQYGGAAIIGAVIGKTLINSMKSGMQEAQQAPHDFISRATQQGGAYGRASLSIRGGDLSLMAAYRMVQNNEQMRKDFSELARGNSTGISGFERSSSGGVAFEAEGRGRTQAALSAMRRATLGMDPLGAFNQARRDVGNLPTQMTTSQLQYLQQAREARPEEFAALYHFQQNAGADIGAMRALGYGASRLRKVDGMGNLLGIQDERANPALRRLRRFSDRAIDRGQVFGAMGQLEGLAGLGAAQSGLLERAVQGSIGHLPGAAHILGQAAQVGSANQLYSGVTGMAGRGSGGIDVGAAGTLGQIVAGTLTNGAAPTSGVGLLNAMSAYARGGTGAEDMLITRGMGQGLGAMGGMFGGRTDPYQQGVNLLSAIRAAPGAGVQAQEYLSQLDPRVLFDIAGGGKVPYELESRGITGPMVQQYARSVLSRMSDRDIGMSPNQGGKADAVQRQSSAIQERFGGSFSSYMKSLKSPEEQQRAIVERGAFLMNAGFAKSDLEAQGFARLEAGFGTQVNRMRRGSVGDAAAGSDQMALERFKSEQEGLKEAKVEQMSPELKGMVGFASEMASTLSNVGNSIGMEAKDVAKHLKELDDAIVAVTRSIRMNAAGPARVGASR